LESSVRFRNEVFEIVGAAIEVHRELGSGFLESVYEEAMVFESQVRRIPCKTQVRIPVYYKGRRINKEFVADYIGYEKILVEFKCISRLSNVEEAQILNYLKATGIKVGVLINFGSQRKLEWKRYVY
jgi:GxxExxY protein